VYSGGGFGPKYRGISFEGSPGSGTLRTGAVDSATSRRLRDPSTGAHRKIRTRLGPSSEMWQPVRQDVS
jgi:hypothetical protein